ncbi:MAG TPA: cell division protein FtsZ [Sandaracinaceae bacterium]
MASADVRVIGVGGAGGNAVRTLVEGGVEGVIAIAANTDTQALASHPADVRLALGKRTTRGLGAGGDPNVGVAAAHESAQSIAQAIEGADLVFVAAGLGGGTGTGAAPVVASIARDAGALVVGVVSLPFTFEGARRRRVAARALDFLAERVDSLLVIENDRLLELPGPEPTALEAFARADRVLADGVRGIGELVTRPGLVNLDFADLRAVLKDGGRAVMGTGIGRGRDRAVRAVEEAVRSPLLAHGSIEGARGALMSFTIDPRLGLARIHEAAARVQAEVDDDAEILFGVRVDPSLVDEVHVTIVAAGMPSTGTSSVSARPASARPASAEAVPAPAPARRRNALVMLR